MSTAAATVSRAVLAAQAEPTPANDASAARTSPSRTIGVHLTEFAPDCAGKRLDHPDRWRTFWSKPPVAVVRAVLARIQRDPGQVHACEGSAGDVDLVGQAPAHLQRKAVVDRGELVPLAIFHDGLTVTELQAALDGLARAGWKPAKVLELDV